MLVTVWKMKLGPILVHWCVSWAKSGGRKYRWDQPKSILPDTDLAWKSCKWSWPCTCSRNHHVARALWAQGEALSWLFCDHPLVPWNYFAQLCSHLNDREQKQYSLENKAQSAFQLFWELAALKITKRIIAVEITESRLNVLHSRGGMAQVYLHGASTVNASMWSIVVTYQDCWF